MKLNFCQTGASSESLLSTVDAAPDQGPPALRKLGGAPVWRSRGEGENAAGQTEQALFPAASGLQPGMVPSTECI